MAALHPLDELERPTSDDGRRLALLASSRLYFCVAVGE
jgi:hypothetical protein